MGYKKTKKRHHCSYCFYNTNVATNFVNHMRTHTGEKPFSCTQCSYSTTTKSNLKKHFFSHTKEKPFACPHCQYRGISKSHLSRHMLTHSGVKIVGLNNDDKRTGGRRTIGALKGFSNTKTHQCSYCSYTTSVTTNLRNHMRTHTGEKPFSYYLWQFKPTWKPLTCVDLGVLERIMHGCAVALLMPGGYKTELC
ncbi:oocyte zinc finger protein XlCOF6-like [Penaeus indicus]|uniref:oocyte zinc finger protein XlCOF6-like n=1 Tax=Penaeus indicus TaxID=29960 RepID=UPI00300BFE04